MIALSWLPALVIAASLPRFVPVFDRWHWEVPPVTRALMEVGRLGLWPIVLLGVGLVALLAAGAAGWVRARQPGGRAVVFVLGAAGLGAFAVCVLGVLVPIVTVPPVSQW